MPAPTTTTCRPAICVLIGGYACRRRRRRRDGLLRDHRAVSRDTAPLATGQLDPGVGIALMHADGLARAVGPLAGKYARGNGGVAVYATCMSVYSAWLHLTALASAIAASLPLMSLPSVDVSAMVSARSG